MTDPECVQFLQWALPRLRLRWAGFRKVRRTVCKRLERRFHELEVADQAAYRAYLERHPEEWRVLDGCCAITISRFYRDRGVFEALDRDVLPALARTALALGAPTLRCWSIGCASGEEPYTVSIIWNLRRHAPQPDGLQIVATDVSNELLARARRGCYAWSSVRELPAPWVEKAFTRSGERYCLREEFRRPVVFLQQDVRTTAAEGPFHLILCRYLAFTYFDGSLQQEVLAVIRNRLVPGGALVIGAAEALPEPAAGFVEWARGIYRRSNG